MIWYTEPYSLHIGYVMLQRIIRISVGRAGTLIHLDNGDAVEAREHIHTIHGRINYALGARVAMALRMEEQRGQSDDRVS